MVTYLILTPGFPENEADTTCVTTVQQFVLSLQQLNTNSRVIVISFQYPFEKRHYTWHGIEVIAIGGKNKSGIKRIWTWIIVYKTLANLYKKHKTFHVLSFWLTECSLVTRLFCERKQIKYFMWIQGQDAKIENKYIKYIKPKRHHLIALSDTIQNEFQKNHTIKPTHVIENGITEILFPPFNSDKRSIDILGAGSLIPIKNYTLFIEIVAEIKKKIPLLKVVIVGNGEEEKQLKALALRLEVMDVITFSGHIPHSEVLDLMRQSKIFLHTSFYEGTPAVSIEALYSGCYSFSKIPLANRTIKNHFVLETTQAFCDSITSLLLKKDLVHERIEFNTIKNSAQKITQLFLNPLLK